MITQEIINKICCPFDNSDLSIDNNSLICNKCHKKYPIINGIPVLLKSVVDNKIEEDSYFNKIRTKTETIDFYNDFYIRHTDYKRYNKADVDFVKKIVKYFNLNKNSKILDIGAGTAYFSKLFENVTGMQIYNSDFSIEGFNIGRNIYKQEKLFVMDAYNIAFKENTFDMILAMGLTPFKKDNENEIIELINCTSKVLKPNGFYIFIWSTNLSNKIKKAYVSTTINNKDTCTFYYNHSRKFIVNSFKHSGIFNGIESYCFIRPLSFIFGKLNFSKIMTLFIELLFKILPPIIKKKLSARLMVVGAKI